MHKFRILVYMKIHSHTLYINDLKYVNVMNIVKYYIAE